MEVVSAFNDGTLYLKNPDGSNLCIGDNMFGEFEIDSCAQDETPSLMAYAQSALNISYEMSMQDINCICGLPFSPTKSFYIEYDTPILAQARWHKKKRINKKWLKRYGMKSDTVKMKAKSRTLSYDTKNGECEFEVDKLEYIFRQDQKRRNFKIEM